MSTLLMLEFKVSYSKIINDNYLTSRRLLINIFPDFFKFLNEATQLREEKYSHELIN